VERHGLVPRTLSTSVKVLTSVFGDPDGLLDLVVVVGDVALEVFGLRSGNGGRSATGSAARHKAPATTTHRNVVVVKGNEIGLGPTLGTKVLELQDPLQPSGRRRGSGHSDQVPLGLERAHIVLPVLNGVFGRDVGLTGIVGLVEEQDVLGGRGPVGLSFVEGRDSVLGSPHHGNVFDTEVRAGKQPQGVCERTRSSRSCNSTPPALLTPSCNPGSASHT
jgi:hypothetical protein